MRDPMKMWQCQVANCGFTYDPVRGDKKGKIPAGVFFEKLPDTWHCPVCGAARKMFVCLGDSHPFTE